MGQVEMPSKLPAARWNDFRPSQNFVSAHKIVQTRCIRTNCPDKGNQLLHPAHTELLVPAVFGQQIVNAPSRSLLLKPAATAVSNWMKE
jgi:hypothetical protein